MLYMTWAEYMRPNMVVIFVSISFCCRFLPSGSDYLFVFGWASCLSFHRHSPTPLHSTPFSVWNCQVPRAAFDHSPVGKKKSPCALKKLNEKKCIKIWINHSNAFVRWCHWFPVHEMKLDTELMMLLLGRSVNTICIKFWIYKTNQGPQMHSWPFS